jgi:hypothetical protein
MITGTGSDLAERWTRVAEAHHVYAVPVQGTKNGTASAPILKLTQVIP